MVLKNFYQIKSKDKSIDSNVFFVLINVNKEHDIFKGHFPDNPVMPGVCMMQIIKEITEEIVKDKLFMESCSNVKFMALINPNVHSELMLEIRISEENDKIKVNNITKFEDTVALKLTAIYKRVNTN